MSRRLKAVWLRQPKGKDYAAAENFLSLLYEPRDAARLIKRLRRGGVTEFVARDVLRASGTSLQDLSVSDAERRRILEGAAIAPLLLVRSADLSRVIVADGFHRLCTLYAMDAEVPVRCQIT